MDISLQNDLPNFFVKAKSMEYVIVSSGVDSRIHDCCFIRRHFLLSPTLSKEESLSTWVPRQQWKHPLISLICSLNSVMPTSPLVLLSTKIREHRLIKRSLSWANVSSNFWWIFLPNSIIGQLSSSARLISFFAPSKTKLSRYIEFLRRINRSG